MHTGTGSNDLLDSWLIELPETIRERTSGVDHTLQISVYLERVMHDSLDT